jgi:hypothetical protein
LVSGSGSGIGTGRAWGAAASTMDILAIWNSTVTASGSHDCSGIGTGLAEMSGSSSIGIV